MGTSSVHLVQIAVVVSVVAGTFRLGVGYVRAAATRPPTIKQLMFRIQQGYPGYRPNAVVDVGANQGLFTRAIHEMFNETKVLMVEATAVHEQALARRSKKLQDDGVQADYRIALLSDTNGARVPFYSNKGSTGNSMFKERTKHFESKEPTERITTTLDTIVADSFLKNEIVDIVKVDVQGAELVVLQGAKELLQQATFVQFEGSTIEYNENGSCAYEVEDFLRSQGYFLYDYDGFVYNNHFKTKGLGQYDALYIRPNSDRLPTFLKKEKPKFCGHGRITERPSFNAGKSTSLPVVDEKTTLVASTSEDSTRLTAWDQYGLPSLEADLGDTAGFIISPLRRRVTESEGSDNMSATRARRGGFLIGLLTGIIGSVVTAWAARLVTKQRQGSVQIKQT